MIPKYIPSTVNSNAHKILPSHPVSKKQQPVQKIQHDQWSTSKKAALAAAGILLPLAAVAYTKTNGFTRSPTVPIPPIQNPDHTIKIITGIFFVAAFLGITAYSKYNALNQARRQPQPLDPSHGKPMVAENGPALSFSDNKLETDKKEKKPKRQPVIPKNSAENNPKKPGSEPKLKTFGKEITSSTSVSPADLPLLSPIDIPPPTDLPQPFCPTDIPPPTDLPPPFCPTDIPPPTDLPPLCPTDIPVPTDLPPLCPIAIDFKTDYFNSTFLMTKQCEEFYASELRYFSQLGVMLELKNYLTEDIIIKLSSKVIPEQQLQFQKSLKVFLLNQNIEKIYTFTFNVIKKLEPFQNELNRTNITEEQDRITLDFAEAISTLEIDIEVIQAVSEFIKTLSDLFVFNNDIQPLWKKEMGAFKKNKEGDQYKMLETLTDPFIHIMQRFPRYKLLTADLYKHAEANRQNIERIRGGVTLVEKLEKLVENWNQVTLQINQFLSDSEMVITKEATEVASAVFEAKKTGCQLVLLSMGSVAVVKQSITGNLKSYVIDLVYDPEVIAHARKTLERGIEKSKNATHSKMFTQALQDLKTFPVQIKQTTLAYDALTSELEKYQHAKEVMMIVNKVMGSWSTKLSIKNKQICWETRKGSHASGKSSYEKEIIDPIKNSLNTGIEIAKKYSKEKETEKKLTAVLTKIKTLVTSKKTSRNFPQLPKLLKGTKIPR